MLYGDITWDSLCDIWDDCSSGRIWDCLTEIFRGAGEEGNEDYTYRLKLKDKEKKKLINIYVQIFKDHLSESEKYLMETAGIKLTYIDQKEINDSIKVIMKAKNIYTEEINKNYTKEEIKNIKTVSLHDLVKLLNIK